MAGTVARKSVFPNPPEREHVAEWNYLQTFKPFTSDLMLAPERVRYTSGLSCRPAQSRSAARILSTISSTVNRPSTTNASCGRSNVAS